MSVKGQTDIEAHRPHVRFTPESVAKLFAPRLEEQPSKSSLEKGILIHKTAVSDSDIAHFWRSTANWPSFATNSREKRTLAGACPLSARTRHHTHFIQGYLTPEE
jgi:hypothetical protein